MNVAFWMAARDRLIYQGRESLAAALLDKEDTDPLVTEIEAAFEKHLGAAVRSPVDAVELMITERVDAGESLPVTNPEGFGAAKWLSQGDMDSLPDPIPRAFALYLAAAWKEADHYPTYTEALTDILATRSFA